MSKQDAKKPSTSSIGDNTSAGGNPNADDGSNGGGAASGPQASPRDDNHNRKNRFDDDRNGDNQTSNNGSHGNVIDDNPIRRARLAFLPIEFNGPPVHLTPAGHRVDFRTYRLRELVDRFDAENVEKRPSLGFPLRQATSDQPNAWPNNLACLDRRIGPNNLTVDPEGGDPLAGISDLVLCLAAPYGDSPSSTLPDDRERAQRVMNAIASSSGNLKDHESPLGANTLNQDLSAGSFSVAAWFSNPDAAVTGLGLIRDHAHIARDTSLIDLADRLLAAIIAQDHERQFSVPLDHAFSRIKSDFETWCGVITHSDSNKVYNRFGNRKFLAGDLAHDIAMARLILRMGTDRALKHLSTWRPLGRLHDPFGSLGLDWLENMTCLAKADLYSDIADALRPELFKKGFKVAGLLALEEGEVAEDVGAEGADAGLGPGPDATGADKSKARQKTDRDDSDSSAVDDIRNDKSLPHAAKNSKQGHIEKRDASGGDTPNNRAKTEEPHSLPLDPRRFACLADLLEVQYHLIAEAVKKADQSNTVMTIGQSPLGKLSQSNADSEHDHDHDHEDNAPLAKLDPYAPYRFADGQEIMRVMDIQSAHSMSNHESRRDIASATANTAGCWLPLVKTPDLSKARSTLLAEFPHLEDPINTILNDLAHQHSVRIAPTLLVGPPGSGKSHLARRIGV